MAASTWDPTQYNRFAAERSAPFWDLAGLLHTVDGPTLVDMGCGDGALTAALHERLGASRTLGIDSSPAMLAETKAVATASCTFAEGDIANGPPGTFDVVLSNAALHWVPDHAVVLRRWVDALTPGGQLAVQVPANWDHPSHVVSRELGAELLGPDAPPDPVAEHVLAPERYAELLHELGLVEQHVRLQVYGHLLPSPAEVVEWVKGTSLTRFKSVLSAEDFDGFVEEYRRRLLAVLGAPEPFFYPFKRILFWGRLAAG
ncbi:MAG TPA: methyltransferase domain-containing protein [Acidimicrobiales bacterium]|nr:methyltransferase domain-containing protein [Acidimicrobiales bacterium]